MPLVRIRVVAVLARAPHFARCVAVAAPAPSFAPARSSTGPSALGALAPVRTMKVTVQVVGLNTGDSAPAVIVATDTSK